MRKGRRQVPVFYIKILSPILAQPAWACLQLRRFGQQLIVGCAPRTNPENPHKRYQRGAYDAPYGRIAKGPGEWPKGLWPGQGWPVCRPLQPDEKAEAPQLEASPGRPAELRRRLGL